VILPVHLYGQLADMDSLTSIAGRHQLAMLEDACQAHGASRAERHPGDQSPAAFSFYPGKNLGAFGDAGAVATNDGALAERIRTLREHGQREKYLHEEIGWTSRLDAFQAAVLSVKLPHLDTWNDDRRRIAVAYDHLLDGVGDLTLPPRAHESFPVWHLYVVRTAAPERLADALRSDGIQSGRHYPQPPHLSGAFQHLGWSRGAFPISEQLADELLSLPIFPGMTDEQIDAVVSSIRRYFQDG
jgi:dTDP-4-amino-4,6-dideoxygalactose transaminase